MSHSILVPLDGSPFGEHALPFALSIACRTSAAIQLAHVHTPPVHVSEMSVFDIPVDEQNKEQERSYLDSVVQRWAAAASGVRMRTTLLEGNPPDALLEQASAGKADLIVMATHGRGAVSRFWLGSVTDALVRVAPVPLLLTRPTGQPPQAAVAPPFHHFLVPLDGSALAEQALGPARELGRLMGARYTLLRVVQPALPGYGLGGVGAIGIDESLTQRIADEVGAYLEGVARHLRKQGLTVQTRVALHTQPAVAILEEAQNQGADLISLATHGRSGIKRLLLGSVADKVVRGVTTPLLLYRPPTEGQGER